MSVYYFTDLHGNKKLFQQVMRFCGDNKIIFGGDCIDRGEDGYSIMKELFNNPNVIYLKGNHEDIFLNATKLTNILYEPDKKITLEEMLDVPSIRKSIIFRESIYNGGYCTLDDWINEGRPQYIIDKIEALPLFYEYHDIDFTHASIKPNDFEVLKKTGGEAEKYECIWSRDFMWDWFPNRFNVHGHTPIQDKWGYNDIRPHLWGHKTRLDMDVCSCITNIIYIFDCDEYEIIGINENGVFDRYKLNS